MASHRGLHHARHTLMLTFLDLQSEGRLAGISLPMGSECLRSTERSSSQSLPDREPLRAEIHTPEDRGLAQKALDMLSGMRVVGRTETEAVFPVRAQLTAVGELISTSRPGAVSSGSIPLRRAMSSPCRLCSAWTALKSACLDAGHQGMVHS